MTVVMPEIDVDPLVLEDIEQAVACECEYHVQDRHSGPAEWVLWFSCCPVPAPYVLMCTMCKDVKLNEQSVVECGDCGEIYDPAPLAYRYVEAINRRA